VTVSGLTVMRRDGNGSVTIDLNQNIRPKAS
jgi:hypothetical protein